MSIRIEVTGNSLGEVADKLLAIGTSLRNTAVNAADDAAREELQAKRNAAPRKAKKAEPEVAEEAPADPTPEPKSAPAVEVTESQPTTEEPASTPAPAASASEPLDFDTEVAPVVIEAVQRVGKPAVSALLAEYGAERASEVDPALYGELVEGLKALS